MNKITKILVTVFTLLLFTQITFAQTTGKISGSVVDKKTQEPLFGANVLIMGTTMGAAVNFDGEYFILNISPGEYSVKVSMVGYAPVIFQGVVVSVNRTTTINAELSMEDLTLEEIVVSVDAVTKKKDQTSSIKNVSADQIKSLPVESISDVVGLQAGVVKGHFRGGRNTEVSYMVDGVSVTDGYSRSGSGVEIETEAVQDMEVITGTFNAEYGRAMSGIVNIVTKEGGKQLHGSFSSSLSNYVTSNNDIFIGLKSSEAARNQDYKFQLEGPIYQDYITFFANVRYEDRKGYLNGIRRFSVDDYSDFEHANINEGVQTPWDADVNGSTYYSEHTGDNEYVPMNSHKEYTGMAKLTFRPFTDLKFSLMFNKSHGELQKYGYDEHIYKYKPDGRRTFYDDKNFYLFQLNHVISNNIFHDLKISYNKLFFEDYLYKDPFDSRYVADNYGKRVGGFVTGGQDKGYSSVGLNDINVKYDITWQVNTSHSLKTGIEFTSHDLTKTRIEVRDIKHGTSDQEEFYYDLVQNKIIFNPYEPEILTESINADNYNKKPYEFSTYLQDKMEFDELVINLGLRYDYFNSNTVYPTQLRNPGNQLSFPDNPERMSEYADAEAQTQISPRFGLSYTLGKSAVLHFSYGHFFQMPPLEALFQNSRFLVPKGDYEEPIMGNPNLKAEKTVQYELGIWQELIDNMGLELSVFYRDIYDLQTAIVVTTYNQIKYGLYSNKDYGNAKGLEVKFDYYTGPFSFFVNYTLQYTRGSADEPKTSYTRAGQNLDPIPTLVPLEWDQRHTLNISVGYEQENFGLNLITSFNSGSAYTYSPIPESPLSKQTLYPNNQHKPSTLDLSLKGHYDIDLVDNVKMRLFLSVYNLLDKLNEEQVNGTTGRAYTAIIRPTEISTFKSNYNDIYDYSQNPSMYAAPREVKIGVGFVF